MQYLETKYNNPNETFIVPKKHSNLNLALLPDYLYKKMETFVLNATSNFEGLNKGKPSIRKLQLLKNAYVNDKLHIKSQIKKFDSHEILLSVVVYKHDNNSQDIICKAIFGFQLDQAVYKAS